MQTKQPLITTLDPDAVEREALGLAPEFHRVTRKEAVTSIAFLLALLVGASAAFYFGSWTLGLFLLTIIVAALLRIPKVLRRSQMGVALPYVLRSLCLEQNSGGLEFNRSLPGRLFPRVGDPLVSTVVSGSIDGFPVAIAELEVLDRRADTPVVLFEGLVLRLGLPTPLPGFLILDAAHSRKMERTSSRTWLSREQHFEVGKLVPCPMLPGGVHDLGLWLEMPADPVGQPLAAVLKVLSCPPADARIDGRIYSATSDGKTIYVALRPADASSRIDMTPASGTNASLAIHATFEWLSQPLALANALIGATVDTTTKS